MSQPQLEAQAAELQSSEAAVEYVRRLLNAVTAENGDLRKQLVKYQDVDQGGRHMALQDASSTGTLFQHCFKALWQVMLLKGSSCRLLFGKKYSHARLIAANFGILE